MNNLSLLLDNPAGLNKRFNVGDDIQTVAAAQFMPSIDGIINKENISKYDGPQGKIVLNGWFMHNPAHWPPPATLDVLMTSLHITEPASKVMLSGPGLAYFKQKAPVGCRDMATLDILRGYGVDAYLSGCLTLTLERSNFVAGNAPRQGVYVVDLFYKHMNAHREGSFLRRTANIMSGKTLRLRSLLDKVLTLLIPDEDRRKRVEFIEHSRPMPNDTHEHRWSQAVQTLAQYANAELVITSRIHCALPCLAFNTPVLFVDTGLDANTERSRIDSQLKFLHVAKVDNRSNVLTLPEGLKDVNNLENKTSFMPYRERLTCQCKSFFSGDLS